MSAPMPASVADGIAAGGRSRGMLNPWLLAFVAGTALVVSSVFFEWSRAPASFDPWRIPWYLGEYVATFALAAGLVLIDRAGVRNRWRIAAIVVAAMVAAMAWFAYSMLTTAVLPVEWKVYPLRLSLANVMINVAINAMIGLGWEFHRRAVRGDEALRALQREQAELARRDLETRLQALQAQVDPQFLFGTLNDVDRLHARAPEAADALLEALIAYLRTALPGLHDRTSSVGREAELVRAYLTVLRLRSEGGIRFGIDVEATAGHAALAPMVLLPLVECLLPDDVSSTSVSIAAGRGRDAGGVRVVVQGDRAVRDERALAAVRERVHAIYGNGARLTRETAARITSLTLELPAVAPAG